MPKKKPEKKSEKKPVKAAKPETKAVTPSSESKDFGKYQKLLETFREQIAGDLQHIEGDALNRSQRDAAGDLSGYSYHMADMATDNFDREFNLGLASNEQKSLNLIDAALRKIKDGSYGVCDLCKKPIPSKRLMAVPHAPFCISCQELEEKQKRPE